MVVHLKSLYLDIIDTVSKGTPTLKDIDDVISKKYDYLKIQDFGEIASSKAFSSNSKSEIFLRDAVQNAPKCKICGGLIHSKSITIDHIHRKEDGGLGTPENGQLAHPYCNTTYKN